MQIRNISKDAPTIINVWNNSKTKFATKKITYFCNSCLRKWNPTHFRQQALAKKWIYALPLVSLRIALSTFRSHETCKVEMQYLKRATQIRKKILWM